MSITRTQGKQEDSHLMCYCITFTQESIESDCAFIEEVSQYEDIVEYQVKNNVASAKVYISSDTIINHLNKLC
jgi:hypothetical protein